MMDSCSSDSSSGGGSGSSGDGFSRNKTATNFNAKKIVWSNQQFIYVGHECLDIPDNVATRYGEGCRRLDLTFNNLNSLKFLRFFTNLEELIVDNNLLDDTIRLPIMSKLMTLSMNKNKIKDLESLLDKINASLPNLEYLSLLGNPACPNQLSCSDRDEEDYYRYRLRVIYRLPTLRFLDSTPIKRLERVEAQRSGPFTRVVKPKAMTNIDDSSDESDEESRNRYTPLPASNVEDGKHKGAYGICRYKYLGLHSEGNRFIRNNDL